MLDIEANQDQIRKSFDPHSINELTESIKTYGLLQPLVVCPISGGEDLTKDAKKYLIIAGERRFRACKQLGLEKILCNILPEQTNQEQIIELCLIENIQRENLNPLEQAHGYMSLIELGYTQQQIATKLSKSRAHIANSLRLLKLPTFAQKQIQLGKLSQSQALELLNHENLTEEILTNLIETGCTVKNLRHTAQNNTKPAKGFLTAEDLKQLSISLTKTLNATVTIDHNQIKISYDSPQQLDTILEKLS